MTFPVVGLVIGNSILFVTAMMTIWCSFDIAGRSWVKLKKYQKSLRDQNTKKFPGYRRSGGNSNRSWRHRYVFYAKMKSRARAQISASQCNFRLILWCEKSFKSLSGEMRRLSKALETNGSGIFDLKNICLARIVSNQLPFSKMPVGQMSGVKCLAVKILAVSSWYLFIRQMFFGSIVRG